MDKSERIKDLVELLNKANKAYYQEANEIMTNFEYDKLYDELVGLEKETGMVFRRHALNPEHPTNRGNNVNPDVYFQCKEGANVKAEIVPDTIQP